MVRADRPGVLSGFAEVLTVVLHRDAQQQGHFLCPCIVLMEGPPVV